MSNQSNAVTDVQQNLASYKLNYKIRHKEATKNGIIDDKSYLI